MPVAGIRVCQQQVCVNCYIFPSIFELVIAACTYVDVEKYDTVILHALLEYVSSYT